MATTGVLPSRASTDSSVVSYDDGNANAIDGTATANPMHAPGIAPPPGGILGQGMATGAAIASQTAGVVNTLAFVERKRGLTAVRLDLLGDKAYGGEDGSDAFWFDYWSHVKNEHPAIGIVGSHPAHPYTKCSRLFSEMVVSCFAFMIAAFDAEANATDPNKDVGGFTRAVLIACRNEACSGSPSCSRLRSRKPSSGRPSASVDEAQQSKRRSAKVESCLPHR